MRLRAKLPSQLPRPPFLPPKPLLLFVYRLAAQLARTEEAAKRALLKSDVTARGGAAQRLLDAERALQQLREENADLANKFSL